LKRRLQQFYFSFSSVPTCTVGVISNCMAHLKNILIYFLSSKKIIHDFLLRFSSRFCGAIFSVSKIIKNNQLVFIVIVISLYSFDNFLYGSCRSPAMRYRRPTTSIISILLLLYVCKAIVIWCSSYARISIARSKANENTTSGRIVFYRTGRRTLFRLLFRSLFPALAHLARFYRDSATPRKHLSEYNDGGASQ